MTSLGSQVLLDGPCVSLELDSRPETLTLVRGMIAGVGELFSVDAELLDDLKTAVSEACNNVVLHAYPTGAPGRLDVELFAGEDEIVVVVTDEGVGISTVVPADDHLQGVGIPVINALTTEADFHARPEGGTEVTMRFAGARDGRRLFQPPGKSIPNDGWSRQLSGDAVASVSPVQLLGTVLGRLARAMAASARFSLDRFSDVYLVTDAIAAHAERSASGERAAFAIKAGGRRLELLVGPLQPGAGAQIRREEHGTGRRSPLGMLSDELEVENIGAAGEMLRVVMIDHRRWVADPLR